MDVSSKREAEVAKILVTHMAKDLAADVLEAYGENWDDLGDLVDSMFYFYERSDNQRFCQVLSVVYYIVGKGFPDVIHNVSEAQDGMANIFFPRFMDTFLLALLIGIGGELMCKPQ